MKNRGLTLAVWLIAVYAVCCAFVSVRVLDMSNVSGKTHSVQVSGSSGVASGAEVIDALNQFAAATGTTIAKEVADLDEPGLRHLYLVLGDPAAREADWLVDGYPWFSPDARTDIHEMGELRDVVAPGTYVVFGGEQTAQGLANQFDDLGFDEVVVGQVPDLGEFIAMSAQEPIGISTVAVMLLVGFLVATSMVAGVKGYSVQRLHGAMGLTMLWRDLRRLAPSGVLSVVIVGVSAALFLARYNGLHQWHLFATVSVGIYVCLASMVAVSYLVACGLIFRVPVLEGIKGRVPWRGAVTAVYLVRAPALVLVISGLAGVLASGAAILDYLPARGAWSEAGRGVTVAFGGSVPVSESERYFADAGEWIRDRELAGDVILALPTRLPDEVGGSAIIVNDAYLARHPVLGEDGTAVEGPADGSVVVLLPADRSPDVETVTMQVHQVLQGFADYRPSSEEPRSPRLDVVVQSIPTGQQVFTYVTDPAVAPYPTFLTSPVVVVVNARTEIVAADDYASFASQGRLIFEDIESAQRTIPHHLDRDFVDGYRLVAQDAAAEYSNLVEALRMSAANAAISLFLLVSTALTLGQLYTRSRGAELFVQYVHGWSFNQMHRKVLRTEMLLGAAVLSWSIVHFTNAQAGRSDPGVRPNGILELVASGYVLAAVLVVTNGVLVMSVIAVLTRRMVRTRTDGEI